MTPMMPTTVTPEALRYAAACVYGSEGFRAVAWRDELPEVPRWTIGHGTTMVGGLPVCQGMCCTKEQADAWAAQDMAAAARFVAAQVTVPLTPWQLGALTSFTYNLGEGAFLHSDVLSSLNRGHYQIAADAMLQYDHAGGVEIAGLTKRRARERALFLCASPEAMPDIVSQTRGPHDAPSTPPPAPIETADDLNRAELDALSKGPPT